MCKRHLYCTYFIHTHTHERKIKRDNLASSAALTKTTTTAKNSISMVKELRRNQHNAFSHAKCFSNRCDNNSVKTPYTQSAKHYDTRHIKRSIEQRMIAGAGEREDERGWERENKRESKRRRIIRRPQNQEKRPQDETNKRRTNSNFAKETASSSTTPFLLNTTNNLCSHIIIEYALIHIITNYVGIDEARKSFIPVSVCFVYIG